MVIQFIIECVIFFIKIFSCSLNKKNIAQLNARNVNPLKKVLVKISLVSNSMFLRKKKTNKTPLPIDIGTKRNKNTVLINGLKKIYLSLLSISSKVKRIGFIKFI